MKTLKVLGLLLTYPQSEMVSALPEMLAVLKEESWLPQESIGRIENLAAWLTMTDLLDVQESYVSLFDRTPSLCLHLFEHVHGDGRDRGPAMVDLAEVYRSKGFEIATAETPDYLPLFLEYLSLQPAAEARENLDNAVDIISAIRKRLEKRETPYAAVFAALESAAARKPDDVAVQRALQKASGAAATERELDAAWEEQFAFDGDGQSGGSCPKVGGMVARLKEMESADKKESLS